MKSSRDGLGALDNVLWVFLCTCGMVGLSALDLSPETLRRFRIPLALGLLFGLITCPGATRWLRPRLARRLPGLFSE